MAEAASSIISRIDALARREGLDLSAILVGSAARKTWLAGDYDLDIFLAVKDKTDLPKALELAKLAAPVHQESYAEHPYIQARISGFDVDLVPCCRLESALCLKSAVDRTPFHTRYVSERIAGLEDDVLLLKQFMKGIGVYGSELRTGGFSGYLSELLILKYRSFRETLEAAGSWHPGVVIDLESHSSQSHDDPLVVVDPVDPKRNVAAALTLEKMLQLAAAARCFLDSPSLEFFFPEEPEILTREEIEEAMKSRRSCFILIKFKAPEVVEDVLFPQLRKAEESVKALLERNDFRVIRSDVDASKSIAMMLFELEVWELPEVTALMGPPVWEKEHLSKFLSSHQDRFFGPYIKEGRAVIEARRKHTHARTLLEKEMRNLALGKHIRAEVRKGCEICSGKEILKSGDLDRRKLLTRYLRSSLKIC